MDISKELLSEVLYIENILNIECNNLNVFYKFGDMEYPEQKGINIHELANLCKEWAIEKGYIVTVVNKDDGLKWVVTMTFNFIYVGFHSDIESEAIFKSCQWVLDNT